MPTLRSLLSAATLVCLAVPLAMACETSSDDTKDNGGDAVAADDATGDDLVGDDVVGDDTGNEGGPTKCVPDAGTPPPGSNILHDTSACGAATDIATADAFLADLAARTERLIHFAAIPKGAENKPSQDLRITADIDVDLTAFRVAHPACTADAGATCVETAFATAWSASPPNVPPPNPFAALPPGVTCVPAECATKVHIAANTVLRVQRQNRVNRFSNTAAHVVELIAECKADCSSPQAFCAEGVRCLGFLEYCLACGGGTRETCACFGACDGDKRACEYDSSEDTAVVGTCKAGRCASD